MPAAWFCVGVTPDGNGVTYNANINVALAVAMPDGGLITPVLKVRTQHSATHTAGQTACVRPQPSQAAACMSTSTRNGPVYLKLLAGCDLLGQCTV